MKNVFFKVLIISILYMILSSCKSQSNLTTKEKQEREDTTEDLRDEQMNDYENDMRDQYEENN